jgi:hypothetical protein
MLSYSRSHLADHVLLRTLTAVVTQDRVTTAELLALIAEVDRRGLFRSEGYPSMFRYCVGRLGMSEDMAYKRIQAARKAREIPAIFSAIADGRLHLTAVVLLRPYLTPSNGAELLSAASGKSKAEVELLIADRFPREDVPTTLTPIPSVLPVQAAETFGGESPAPAEPAEPPQDCGANVDDQLVPEPVVPEKSVPIAVSMVPPMPQRRVAPLSPRRFELKLTISQEFHDKLMRAEELLSHAVPSGDIPQLLERALDELISKQEKLQLAATGRPRMARGSGNPRYICAPVKRAVRKRDRGQCTYISGRGHRCGARKFLQYDHVIPVARGGISTVENLRLRCRAHNQLEAERTFGAGFMEGKRARRKDDCGRTPILE